MIDDLLHTCSCCGACIHFEEAVKDIGLGLAYGGDDGLGEHLHPAVGAPECGDYGVADALEQV